MEFSQEVLDLSWFELKKFDDGDYYPDERGDGLGVVGFLLLVIAAPFLIGGMVNESWFVASPGIALVAYVYYRAAKIGSVHFNNRLNRLRTVAQIMVDEEYARQAEEEMV